jgi:putative toxin-antitoxin system antitoxin component (TIGR02293 family)
MNLARIYSDENRMLRIARKGITKAAYEKIADYTGLTDKEFSSLIHITTRTLQRKEANELLPIEASERVVLIGKIYYKGEQTFGSSDKFKQWMQKKSAALNNKTPLSYLDTLTGITIIQDELVRIEHGIF